MKKILIAVATIVLAVVAMSALAWMNRENILAHFLSRHLRVPVRMQTLDLSKHGAYVSSLWIGTPPKSHSSTSFASKTLDIQAPLKQILSDPLIIDSIEIADIFVGIEFYDKKKQKSNWDYILQEKKKPKSSKNYLIRTLVLKNLTVEVTQSDGKIKRYPTIKRMEFHNISNETGFPVEDIEKAIFNLMLQDLFQKLPIDQIFNTINPYLPIPLNMP